MTSSTVSSDPRHARHTLALIGLALLCWAGSHLLMERAARFVEMRSGEFLWWQEEFLQLLTPTNYIGRGAGRLMLYGPSEAREGLMPEAFDEVLAPDLRAYQNSQTVAIMDDGLVLLDYIAQAYGEDAVPDGLVFGITTRVMANIRFWEDRSPIYWSIDHYSPWFKTDRESDPPRLAPKSTWESLYARLDFLTRQQRRYTLALVGLGRMAIRRVDPELAEDPDVWYMLTAHKFHHLPRHEGGGEKWLENPGNPYGQLFHWNPEAYASTMRDRLQQLRRFADEHGMEVFVVNLPENVTVRRKYDPGVYEAYLRIVREGLGDTPFLDLRDFLDRGEFYDHCHPTRSGSRRMSRRIAEFIAEQRRARGRP